MADKNIRLKTSEGDTLYPATKITNLVDASGESVSVATLDANSKVPVANLPAMTGATGSAAGTAGAVPAPSATDNTKFLRGDGTWAEAGGGGTLPEQTGQSGKFLKTDGTDASWENVDALPSQTGQSGKYLTTDGSNASWEIPIAGMPLFYHTFQDHLLNNSSWLRSDTFSWQSGAVYTSAYQHLVDDLEFVDTSEIFYRDRGYSYTAVRSPSNDVSGLYAWYDSRNDALYYTETKIPSVGDHLYDSDHNPSRYTIRSVDPSYGPSVPSETETIGGITITLYRATDGHKIVLADQQTNVESIYAATGVAWYYILDTTNQRFKLPRSKWNFVGLRDSVGGYIAPGLPNITGGMSPTGLAGVSNSYGAFYDELNNTTDYQEATREGYGVRWGFNASRSSSIYGNSNTVQPPATQAYLYFYVGNTIQNQTTIDVGEMTEAINDKVDLASSWGTLSTTYDNLTEPSNNGYIDITAPADGWLYYARRKATSDSNTNMWAVNTSHTEQFQIEHDAYWGGTLVAILFPVKKGNTIRFGRNNLTGDFIGCRFYYAQKTN